MTDPNTNITSRFDFEVICGGIIRMIREQKLLEKFHRGIDQDYFFYGDKSLRIRSFRKIVSLVTGLCKDGKLSFITSEYIEARLRQSAQSEENDEAITLFKWMLTNENVQKKSFDDGCLQIFLDYLKVSELLKWSKPFQTSYRDGDIETAVDSIRNLLPRLEQIKVSDDYEFDVDDIDSLLPNDVNEIKDTWYIGCPPLDYQMGGFEKQTLCLFLTVTGGGKSMMAHHILRQSIKQKKFVHITCVEDRPKSFARRLVAALTGIEIRKLRMEFDTLTELEKKYIQNAKKLIKTYVKVEFVYGESVDSVHKRKLDYDLWRKSKGLPPVTVDIIDYTAHIASFCAGDKKHEQLLKAYAARKDFALKYNKIVFDFAQVNREGNHKMSDEKILTHGDLAGGYDLATVCDYIFSINRNARDQDMNKAKLFVSKGRDGGGGTFSVTTDFGRARWKMDGDDVIWENASLQEEILPKAIDSIVTGEGEVNML